VDRQELDLGAGVLDSLTRLFEFHALDTVGGQYGDATAT
jgi:hypothetical protein